MNIKHISKFQKSISFLLLLSILFVFSCSNENSVTNSTNQNDLNKPYEIFDNNSTKPINTGLQGYGAFLEKIFKGWLTTNLGSSISDLDPEGEAHSALDALCFLAYIASNNPKISDGNSSSGTAELYKLRDNYLSNSEKGVSYIYSYYLLSGYGMENNLVMKYPLEHLAIMESGILVSKELQQGNTNKILIKKSTYDDLKKISKIYRESENYKDIEPVLDYLDADLENYYKKPKAEIAADFGF